MVDTTRRRILSGLAISNVPLVARAECTERTRNQSSHTRVDLISNAFPAMSHLAKVAEGCNTSNLRVAVKLTPTARQETEQGFAMRSRCPFDAAIVSMSVFSDLFARGQLSSMSDLEAATSQAIPAHHRVTVNEKLVALAFMSNTQILYYREDLLRKYGLPVPRNYAEMHLTAEILRKRDQQLRFPIAQTFAKGWDCATEFTNLFVALGGRFFKPGTAEPVFDTEIGVATIELMRKHMRFMSPNALSSNSDDVMNQLQQGRAAMGVLWASRASRMDDAASSRVIGKIGFAAAPSARPGGPTAAHLWWDGFVMPRKSKAPRDLTFQVLQYLLSPKHLESGNDLAIWTSPSFRPGRFGRGVSLATEAGAALWPVEPFFGLAHAELGQWIPEALAGGISAKDALRRASSSFLRLAGERGYLLS